MRIIKPGKLGIVGSEKTAVKRGEAPAKTRDVWEDFTNRKKVKKKVEFERTDGDRLVAKNRPKTLFPIEGGAEELPVDPSSFRSDFDLLEERLGYKFNDPELLRRAITHRSALGGKERVDYERLEFLGDAVLDLTVAHLLSEKYLDAKEGDLSKMRAALVNTQALANVAKSLDVGPFIRLGHGEASSGGQERPSILADVMEALIGATYQDGSYALAFEMIKRIFGELLDEVQPSDPKTELQELLHAAGSEPPHYLLEMVEGPEHAPTFVTVVIIDGEIAGRGRGATKKGAQQAAAAEALGKMLPTNLVLRLPEGQKVILAEALLGAPIQRAVGRSETGSFGA